MQIQQLAQELGFEYNHSAKSLKLGKVGTVGIIGMTEVASSLFLDNLIRNITHDPKNGFIDYIVSYGGQGDVDFGNIRRLYGTGKVDGFILINHSIPKSDFEYLIANEVPFVVLHLKPNYFPLESCNFFVTDHRYGAQLATDHLLDQGRRKLLCITETLSNLEFRERYEGFRSALETAGLPYDQEDLVQGLSTFEFGYHWTMENKDRIQNTDGIFVHADITAFGVIAALSKQGIRVPEDISVVGYDDIPYGQFSSPRLSTVHQPLEDMDHQACLRIHEMINQKEPGDLVQRVFLPGLVVRESSVLALAST